MSLVPYRKNAYSIGKWGWEHRQQIFKGLKMGYKRGRSLGRMVANKRRRIMKRIGYRPGFANALTKELEKTVSAPEALSTRTLYTKELTNIAKETTGDEIDRRNRDLVNIRGVKLCMQFQNENSVNLHMYVNVAIISPKDCNTTPTTTEFFRSFGASRSEDFDPATMTAIMSHYRGINRDIYDVIMHKRMRLGPSIDDSCAMTNPRVKVLRRYVKIGRQFRFKGSTASPSGRSLWLVYWCDKSNNLTSDTPVANQVFVQHDTALYFRESK